MHLLLFCYLNAYERIVGSDFNFVAQKILSLHWIICLYCFCEFYGRVLVLVILLIKSLCLAFTGLTTRQISMTIPEADMKITMVMNRTATDGIPTFQNGLKPQVSSFSHWRWFTKLACCCKVCNVIVTKTCQNWPLYSLQTGKNFVFVIPLPPIKTCVKLKLNSYVIKLFQGK